VAREKANHERAYRIARLNNLAARPEITVGLQLLIIVGATVVLLAAAFSVLALVWL
jgi:hypothetical protein